MDRTRFRSRIKINIAASWVTHAIGLLIVAFLMPFVLRTLGDGMYGTWLLINSVAGYSGLLYFGFGQTICRYVSRHHARQEWDQLNRVVNVIFAAYLALGSLALAIAGVLAWLAPALHDWDGLAIAEVRLVILILGLNVAVGMTGSVFGGVLMGIQRFDIERGTSLVSGVTRLVLTVVFLSAQGGLLTLALIFLAVTVVENVGNVLFAYAQVKQLSIHRRYLRWGTLRECFSFSSFAFLDAVAFQVINLTDTVIIGVIFGAKAIVPYAIAQRLCRLIGAPITQVGHVFMPRAGELHAKANLSQLQKLVTKGMGFSFLLAMGFFVGAGFFGDELIQTWIGPGYGKSHLLLFVLLGAQIVAIPVDILRMILFGTGCVRVPALVHLAEAVANVGLTLLLIRPFGLMGVAFGTVIPVVVLELGFLVPYAMRTLEFDVGRLIREALAPQLLPLTLLLAYSFFITATIPFQTGWIPLLATTMGGGVALAIGWLGHDRAERLYGS